MNKPEDAYIIEQVKQGNTAVFSELVDRYKQGAFTVCVRVVGNYADAEEVCQEGFIKAFRSITDFRYEAGFSTWLYRIMFNTSISFLRKKKIKTTSYDDLPQNQMLEDDWENCWRSEENEIKKRIVRESVQALDELDRTIVTLYYTFEHSMHEIARITNLTETNVKVRMHRARLRLQEEIKARLNIHSLI